MNSASPVRFVLRIAVSADGPRSLVLEPWTGEYRLAPETPLDVLVEGTPATSLLLEVDGDQLTLCAFETTDAMLTVYRAGRELRSEHIPPAG